MILVFGGNGKLVHDLILAVAGHAIQTVSYVDADITDSTAGAPLSQAAVTDMLERFAIVRTAWTHGVDAATKTLLMPSQEATSHVA